MKKISICGIIASLMQMALGVIGLFNLPEGAGRYIEPYTFGADYYTEEYHATRAILLDQKDSSYMTRVFMQYMFVFIIILGIVELCYFLIKVKQADKENKIDPVSLNNINAAENKEPPIPDHTWKCPECGMLNSDSITVCKACSYMKKDNK